MRDLGQDVPGYTAAGREVEIFELAWQKQWPVLIKGPTGCGKSRFVAHMAARLGLPLFTVACHDDLSAADLVGRHLITHEGTVWNDGPLTRAVRSGGMCYLDEVVEARKDTTVVLHPLADDRRVFRGWGDSPGVCCELLSFGGDRVPGHALGSGVRARGAQVIHTGEVF